MNKDSKIEYKVKFGEGSDDQQTPLSIIRKKIGKDLFIVESCNKYQGWTPRPHLISCWIGASDGDWYSAPEGEDMPIEFIEKWINKWEKYWTN